MIVKQGGSYYVLSEKGKHLGGPYKSRKRAARRLAQVEYFKHFSKSKMLALWANDIQRKCLLETDDVEVALSAADIILSTEMMPEDFFIPLALPGDTYPHIPLGKGTEDKETDEQFKKRTQKPTTVTTTQQPTQAHLDAVHNAVLKHEGGINLAKLVHVRPELAAKGMNRQQQDAAIHELRRQNWIQASGLEGRHGTTPEEREAAIREGDNLLGHLLFVNPQAARARGVKLASEEPTTPQTKQHTKTIEEFEHPDSEAWSLPVEHVVLRAANGNHVHYAGNSAKEVTIPQEHRHLLKDSIYTHNHPTGTNALSVRDVGTAVDHNIAEMRAITHNKNDNKRYIMSLKRPKGGWHPNMVTEYNQAKDNIIRDVQYSPTMHQQIADKMHLALGTLANKYDAAYERKEIAANHADGPKTAQ